MAILRLKVLLGSELKKLVWSLLSEETVMRGVLSPALVLALCGVASAAPMLDFIAPSQYTPGVPFLAELRLSGAADLAGFGMNVVLAGSTGVGGTDFAFSPIADPSSDGEYVFHGLDPLFVAVDPAPGDDPCIAYIGDTIAPSSVSTSPGHELLAFFEVQTDAAYTGTLSLSVVNDEFLELFRPPQGETFPDIDGFAGVVANLPAVRITPTPEPATMTLLALGAAAMLRRRRR